MQPIATIKKTKEIQEKYNVFTKKTYGQNFIIEPKVVEKIAQAAIKDPNELVFEIGPGIGALTQFLCQRSNQVIAFEIDEDHGKDLKELAKKYFKADKITIEKDLAGKDRYLFIYSK